MTTFRHSCPSWKQMTHCSAYQPGMTMGNRIWLKIHIHSIAQTSSLVLGGCWKSSCGQQSCAIAGHKLIGMTGSGILISISNADAYGQRYQELWILVKSDLVELVGLNNTLLQLNWIKNLWNLRVFTQAHRNCNDIPRRSNKTVQRHERIPWLMSATIWEKYMKLALWSRCMNYLHWWHQRNWEPS